MSDWRICEFCKCRTNAAARACCDKGRDEDHRRARDFEVPAMTIDLKAIRERARHAKSKTVDSVDGWRALRKADDDRAQLLALVGRLREQLDEASTCITTLRAAYVDCSEHAKAGEWVSDPRCGWCQSHEVRQRCNALLRDLDGDARGGGR